MSYKKIKLSSLSEEVLDHIFDHSGIKDFDNVGKLITPYDEDHWKIKFKGRPDNGYLIEGYLLISITNPYIIKYLLAEADSLEELEELKTKYDISNFFEPFWKLLSTYEKRKQELEEATV